MAPAHHELWLDQKLATFAAMPEHYFRVMVLASGAVAGDGRIDRLVDTGVPTTWVLYDDGLVHEFARRYRDALPEIRVTDEPTRPNEMMQVELQLSWKGIAGTRQRRSVRTYYSKDGLYDYYYTLARPPA